MVGVRVAEVLAIALNINEGDMAEDAATAVVEAGTDAEEATVGEGIAAVAVAGAMAVVEAGVDTKGAEPSTDLNLDQAREDEPWDRR